MTTNIGIADPPAPTQMEARLAAEALARQQRWLELDSPIVVAAGADVHWSEGQCWAELRSCQVEIGPQRLNLLPFLSDEARRWLEEQFVRQEKQE